MGTGPPTYSDLLFLPGLLTFLGIVVYTVTTIRSRHDDHLTPFRFIGMGLIVIGFLFGFGHVWSLVNPSLGAFYRASLAGYSKRFIFAHYFSALAPLVVLAVIFAIDHYLRKNPIE